jgi:rubredoxin
VDTLATCPECGSDELHQTKRILPDYTEIKVTVCGVCHWASDPRVGRPPADRSKNVTLRRLMHDAKKPADDAPDGTESG